eukprot:g7514.t1
MKLWNRAETDTGGRDDRQRLNFARVFLDDNPEVFKRLPGVWSSGAGTDSSAQEKKVQKLAEFTANAAAYMVDNAVGGSTKIADADALEAVIADTTAAAIEAFTTNL